MLIFFWCGVLSVFFVLLVHTDSAETLICLVKPIELMPYARHQADGTQHQRVRPFQDSKGAQCGGETSRAQPATGAHKADQRVFHSIALDKGLWGFSREKIRPSTSEVAGCRLGEPWTRTEKKKKELSQVQEMKSKTTFAKGKSLSPPRDSSDLISMLF